MFKAIKSIIIKAATPLFELWDSAGNLIVRLTKEESGGVIYTAHRYRSYLYQGIDDTGQFWTDAGSNVGRGASAGGYGANFQDWGLNDRKGQYRIYTTRTLNAPDGVDGDGALVFRQYVYDFSTNSSTMEDERKWYPGQGRISLNPQTALPASPVDGDIVLYLSGASPRLKIFNAGAWYTFKPV